jgi:ABC-type sugar transport system permease subunit
MISLPEAQTSVAVGHAAVRRTPPRRWRARRTATAYLMLLPAAITVAAVIAYPLVLNYRLSLTNARINEGTFIGLRNYQQLFTDPLFWVSAKNNLLLLLSVPILVVLSTVIAWLLYEQIPGWRLYRALLFLPYVLPIIVVGVVFNFILSRNGFLNTGLKAIGLGALAPDWLGNPRIAIFSVLLVIVWKQVGFGIVLCLARLLSVDRTLFEAARVDGASGPQLFRHIAIPQLAPILEFYIVWNVLSQLAFVFGYVFSITGGGPGDASYVLELYIYRLGFRNQLRGAGAAAAGVLLVGVFLFIALQVRFLAARREAE